MMYAKYALKVLITVPLWLLGVLFGWILDLVTPKDRRTWPVPILDLIYGNKVDGIDGDAAYKKRVKHPFLRRYRWCFLRNPLNNWLRYLGPNGTVWYIRHRKYGRISLTTCKVCSTPYFFADIRITDRWHLWFGYRLFRDDRTKSKLIEGHHLENTMLIWPIKKV